MHLGGRYTEKWLIGQIGKHHNSGLPQKVMEIIVGYWSMCEVGGDNVVHFSLHYPIAGKIVSHSFLLFDIRGVSLKRLWNCVCYKAILVLFAIRWYIFLELGLHPFCVLFIRNKIYIKRRQQEKSPLATNADIIMLSPALKTYFPAVQEL